MEGRRSLGHRAETIIFKRQGIMFNLPSVRYIFKPHKGKRIKKKKGDLKHNQVF